MTTLPDHVAKFLSETPVGVLGTVRPDGRVRQSVVYFVLDADRIWISSLDRREKARDIERTAWASLCVQGPARPFPSVTVEGAACVRRDKIAEPMALVSEAVRGQPTFMSDEEWSALGRVLLEISIERLYGVSYLDPESD